MFEVVVRGRFSAAHRVEGYAGDCAKLHGHNWTVELRIAAKKLNDVGMAFDFREAKKVLGEVLSLLDHTYLNENPLLGGQNPTAEVLAKVIYDQVASRIGGDVAVASVMVWESEGSAICYRP